MSYNKYYESWFRGNNTITQGSGYSDNVSLRNDGRTELRGDTYITNSGRLMINKDKNTSTTYNLDVNGNSNFTGEIVLSNKNTLSKVQIISSATTLLFGSGEYVCISSSFPNNGQITLPLVNNANQIGTKYTFFYGSATYPNVSIYANTGQTIADNTTGIDNTFVNIDSNKPFIELVCVGSSGVCWAQCNGLYSYTEFGGLIQDNNWTGLNTFNSFLPTSTLTPSSNTQLITKVYADGLITTLKSSANAWTNTNTFNTSLPTSTLTPTTNTQLITKAYADGNFQPISAMSNYVLQTYLIANYHTTTYIEINFASLFTNNTFLGDCSFAGIIDFQNNVSITNSKTLTVQSASNLTMDTGSNLYVNGGMTVTGLATFQSPNEPTLNGVRIANLDDIKYPQTEIYAPSFRSTTQSAGGVICGFNTLDGDSRFVMIDEGAGLTPNSAVIQTLAGNGIGIQAVYGTINLFCGTTLRTQVTSTGLSITGDISYTGTIAGISSTVLGYLSGATSNIQTQISNIISGSTSHTNITFSGTLNSMTTTIFSAINTAFGKQTASSAGGVITGATSLSAPFANVYSVNNGATAFTITIPQASASNAGVILTFRRATGSTTTTVISITTSGSTQSMYNVSNGTGTTLVLLASGGYTSRICSITNGSSYAWYLV